MEFKDSKAIYLQISDYVFERILLAQWPMGDKVPSVRELAATLEVNPNTVARSYEMLQNLQVIRNQRGVGFFVAEDATEKIKAMRRREFMETELPVFFKNLYLLDIDIETLKTWYETYLKTTFHHETK